MTKSQCISVTDLRTNTKKCLEATEKEPKYIFVNNKPVAVLINIDQYEANFSEIDLKELPKAEVSKELKKEAFNARKTDKSELINI